ncbi:MAG: sulfite exporter TauE/SafE family protein [Lachnospiraceae bacterium]
MKMNDKRKTIDIGGMTCSNCQTKIEKGLKKLVGMTSVKVDYKSGKAEIVYDSQVLSFKEIENTITNLGYHIVTGKEQAQQQNRLAGVLLLIVASYFIIRHLSAFGIFNSFPLAEEGMGYGMLFVIGLLTSVHCIAMCGGINLSQCIPTAVQTTGQSKLSSLRPGFLYNLGRVISYTVVGVIVGALGSVISFSGTMKGVIQLLAGIFMVLMGINMLGIFPGIRKFIPRMPAVFARVISQEKRSNSPLYVGLLNGLMPCGPLQAMQLYALSTGSPLKGGITMLIFSLGTVPLMFGLGALSSILSTRFTKKMMTVGAALVIVLGVFMFSNGWSLSGFLSPAAAASNVAQTDTTASDTSSDEDTVQEDTDTAESGSVQKVSTSLANGYEPIQVKAGIPVEWTINVPQGSLTGCNYRMVIPSYNIEHTFSYGENVIEFTPTESGTVSYTCWMGMIRSTITVE